MEKTFISIPNLEDDNWQHIITQTVVLKGVSWQTYQALLADLGDHRATRLAYDKGILEIIMPSKLHEIVNRLLARIVVTLTEELNLSVEDFGSTTLEREDLDGGAEPDTCFYIQNAARIQGLDPEIPDNLPPDLAIEVDITSPSNLRLEIYKQLGIPEVWRYTKKGLKILRLQDGEYVDWEYSPTFPMISAALLTQFIKQRQTLDTNGVIRSVREYIREWQKQQHQEEE